MGLHYVDFTFAFDTTLIQLEMTEIWPKHVAQAFLPPPPELSAQGPPDRVNIISETLANSLSTWPNTNKAFYPGVSYVVARIFCKA